MLRGNFTLAGIGPRLRTNAMLALSIAGVTQPSRRKIWRAPRTRALKSSGKPTVAAGRPARNSSGVAV